MCVCVYVCVYMCVCVSALQPKRLVRFWRKFTQILSRISTCAVFLIFWKFEFDDVIAAILHKTLRALSRLQYCSDCLLILICCSINSGNVCYCISAKSVHIYDTNWMTAFGFGIKNDHLDPVSLNQTNRTSMYTELKLLNMNMSK